MWAPRTREISSGGLLTTTSVLKLWAGFPKQKSFKTVLFPNRAILLWESMRQIGSSWEGLRQTENVWPEISVSRVRRIVPAKPVCMKRRALVCWNSL